MCHFHLLSRIFSLVSFFLICLSVSATTWSVVGDDDLISVAYKEVNLRTDFLSKCAKVKSEICRADEKGSEVNDS